MTQSNTLSAFEQLKEKEKHIIQVLKELEKTQKDIRSELTRVRVQIKDKCDHRNLQPAFTHEYCPDCGAMF